MSIVLDLIILAIIIITAYISAKKGFVKVLVETVGFVLAIVIAFTVSTPLAEITYDKFIEPTIIKSAEKAVENGESVEIKAWESVPTFITENVEHLGISTEEFSKVLNENISSGAKKAVAVASQRIIKPVCVNLIGMIYSVILMVVLLILVKFVAKFLNGLFSFSIVGKLNRTLGGITGIFKGTVFVVVFCTAVTFILSAKGKIFNITYADIEKTYIFKEILNVIPFKF